MYIKITAKIKVYKLITQNITVTKECIIFPLLFNI